MNLQRSQAGFWAGITTNGETEQAQVASATESAIRAQAFTGSFKHELANHYLG